MLPRLDAEERLSNIDTNAVSFGALQPDDAERVIARLECTRDGVVMELPKPVVASPDQLGGIGIGVTIVGADGMPVDG